VIDTSVLVAGLVAQHEHHEVARPAVLEAADGALPGVVLAEAWSVLRRRPFELGAAAVSSALAPWTDPERVLVTPAELYVMALRDGPKLHLGGNVHDYLILLTCQHHGVGLATLDARQARLADHVAGLSVQHLLDDSVGR
jgi:predicted nucleic acid-binding protein